MAIGSEEITHPIPGIENAIMSDNVLLGNEKVGENVIVIGCGLVGAEVAYYVAEYNKNINVFEALENPDLGIGGIALLRRHGLFDKYGIRLHLKTPIVEIYEDGVLTVDDFGRKIITNADTIISAVSRKSVYDADFIKALRESGIVIKPVGDAKKTRKISEVIYERFNAAMNI